MYKTIKLYNERIYILTTRTSRTITINGKTNEQQLKKFLNGNNIHC